MIFNTKDKEIAELKKEIELLKSHINGIGEWVATHVNRLYNNDEILTDGVNGKNQRTPITIAKTEYQKL